MKVKDILSGEVIPMTPELYQEFAQGGCVPACHLTNQWINIGDMFYLATVPNLEKIGSAEYIDVMLAEKSSVKAYIDKINRKIKEKRKEWERTGCFRVDGQIIHID